MSIVIIGGNECMECRYREICKKNGYKAKVFTKEKGAIRKKLGCPDLMVLFTNTVSHKMVNSATQEAKRMEIPILHIHSSSSAAGTGRVCSKCGNVNIDAEVCTFLKLKNHMSIKKRIGRGVRFFFLPFMSEQSMV